MSTALRIAIMIVTLLAATPLNSASYAGRSVPLLDLGYSLTSVTIADLRIMAGKRVLGRHGELLGHLGEVDEQAQLVELSTSEGAIVLISTELLVKDGNTLTAHSLSRDDIVAIIDRAATRSGRGP